MADANRAMAEQVIDANRSSLALGRLAGKTLLTAIGNFNAELATVRLNRDGSEHLAERGVFDELADPGARIEQEIQATMAALNCDKPTAVQWIINNVRNPQPPPPLPFVDRVNEVVGDLQPDEERSR